MSARPDLVRRVAKKQQEIEALEAQSAAISQQLVIAKAYKAAMEEALRLIDKDAVAPRPVERALRRGSSTAKAQKALRKAGRPMHIKELVQAIGKEPTRTNRSALSSSLSAYARRGAVFTRPAPNTFGLVEMREAQDSEGEGAPGDGKADGETPLMRLAASRQ